MNTLAIDIGGSKFSIAVFTGDRMMRRESFATDREGGREWLLEHLEPMACNWKKQYEIERCGIGFGGPVLFHRQTAALSTHVGGWKDFPLACHMHQLLGIPTVMDNDANVGALGEARHGAGHGVLPLFYMTVSTGIGGGIILEDGIYRGADSWAGEIGHITIDPDGPVCLCGARGCLERMCGGLWLERDHGRPARELMADPAFVEGYVSKLALGIRACIMLLNPARIVIGGGIAKAGDALFAPLRGELGRRMTGWSRARVDVAPAALGDDSVLYGALELAKTL